MIESRITSKAQTTIPRAVRLMLGLRAGDRLGYRLDGGQVVLVRVAAAGDVSENPFASFTEWSDPLDAAYDDL